MEESLTAENYTRQSEKIRIGGGAYLEARFDVLILIRGTVKMEAAAMYGDKESKEGATTNARNILDRREQIDLEKQARLRTYYGDITLHIIASGDDVRGQDESDQITARVQQKRKSGKNITGMQAENEIKVTAHINTWENSEIYAPFGTVNLKVQDGYGGNSSDTDTRRTHIVAKAEGKSSKVDNAKGKSYARNQYGEDLQVNVKHSTITGNNVNLTATR